MPTKSKSTNTKTSMGSSASKSARKSAPSASSAKSDSPITGVVDDTYNTLTLTKNEARLFSAQLKQLRRRPQVEAVFPGFQPPHASVTPRMWPGARPASALAPAPVSADSTTRRKSSPIQGVVERKSRLAKAAEKVKTLLKSSRTTRDSKFEFSTGGKSGRKA